MNKIDIHLNFNEIRERIEMDLYKYKPGEWANLIKVSKSLISNVHGKSKNQNPPLPYIIAVARVTGKPVEWYLYGKTADDMKIAEPAAKYDECPDEIRDSCRKFKNIILSKHPVIVPALLSNLAAFEYSIEKEKDQDEKIKRVKKRVKDLEDALKKGRLTGIDGAASSSTGKQET